MILPSPPAYSVPATGIGMAFTVPDLRYYIEVQRSLNGTDWVPVTVLQPQTLQGTSLYDNAPLDGTARYYRARLTDLTGRTGAWLACTPTTGKPKQLKTTAGPGRPQGPFLTASDLTNAVRQPLTKTESRFRVYAYHSTTQSIADDGASHAVAFDSENDDTGGLHDNVTNNSRVTIPAANYQGLWLMVAQLRWTGNVTGVRVLTVVKNNTTVVGQDTRMAVTATFDTFQQVTVALANVSPGDYFEVFALQKSGAGLNLIGSPFTGTFFQATHVW